MAYLCQVFPQTDMSYHELKFFSISSNLKQVNRFSTARGPGQMKLFITAVLIYYFFKAFFIWLTDKFHGFRVTVKVVLLEFNRKGMNIKGGNKCPLKDMSAMSSSKR